MYYDVFLEIKFDLNDKLLIFVDKTIGPETRVFIPVALTRVNASHWFNMMTRLASFYRK